uniref:Venom fibrillin 1 n=1 Tax=Oncocephalus sp. TaxID=2944721 RepID=A0AB38ZEV4_9HEMI
MYVATTIIGNIALLLLAIITFAIGDPAANYYKELECLPVGNEGTPSRYNCSILDRITENKCFFKGKEYAIDETIKDQQVNDKCIVECTCIQIYTTNKARWSCVDIECPELFHRQQDCKYLYDGHEKCCSTSKICGDEQVSGTCTYAGKTYVHGEKFYPNEDKCKTCICGEGFNGSLTEPWCETISCNLYLHYLNYIREGCLPTYYETDSCCPIPVWRCPKLGDTVITPKNVEPCESESCKEDMCKFGNLTLAKGQKLSPSTEEDSKNVECSCQVPPHLTCIMINKNV